MRGVIAMQRRINVSLSEEAVRLLDRMAPKGDRSRFLDDLVKRTAGDRAQLRARLKEGYIKRAQRDREVAAQWDAAADEVWQRDVRR
jgi:CopG family transcriptional regulator / antitoxin EndoAI